MFRVFLRPVFLLPILAVFFACHLTQSGKTDPVFDFPTLKSTIGDADHATIILKDSTGRLIDTLFHAAVTPSTTFRGLAAPGYDGGKATLHIEATKNGEVVYKVERGYDGKSGGNQGTAVIQVSPGTTVDIEWILPRIREGDSIALPAVKIQPSHLSDKSLSWQSRQPHLLSVTATHLKALAPGTAVLVTILKSDTTRKDSLAVEIVARNTPSSLDSLILSPDPLTLALRGPIGRFSVTVHPATASKEVAWTSLDSSVVSVSDDGSLTPLTEGQARIVATSTVEPILSDTARVQVMPPLKVDSVRLHLDSLEVFANGAAEELLATVYPLLANPKVRLLSRDPTLVQVESTQVQGLQEGETYIQVRSVEDESKTDSLKVIVFPSQKVDSVRVNQDTLRLYVNGESRSLKATIHPSTLQSRFSWSSGNPKVATVDAAGKVSPSGEGKTYVSARARADGSKSDSSLIIVKKDTPRLRVGSDTIISAGTTLTFRPEAPQDYGLVVLFKWDLTGDGNYEDSSTTLKAELTQHYAEVKDYEARFYVRDTEGNDTVVVRKVRAVTGRVVQITNPKDGAFVNTTPITVTWTVDGNTQSNSQALNPGATTVVRSAQDSAGKVYGHTITVHLDQTAPNRPIVRGATLPVNTLTPEWRWSSGGGGGSGMYRYRIGDPDLSAQVTSPDTLFTAPSNLSGGTHTLYVQERDEAGNWSANGSFAVRIDTTPPPAPTASVLPTSPSRNARPTWSWTGGTGDIHRYYRFKLDNDDFRSGAKDTIGTTFTPTANLSDTVHTLYVQERDSAGNWSATASRSITIDTQAPAAPTVSVSPAALTNDDTPTWSWTAVPGATGYRFKLNDANLETGGTETPQLSFTPVAGLGEGTFTLYAQARDAAGNWSLTGSRQVRIDLTPPTPPRIDSTPYSPLNSLRPRWTWRSGTDGAKVFRARVGNPDLNGQPEQQDSSFTPAANLQEGLRTLYTQERDSAGNWSTISKRSIIISIRGLVGGQPVSSGEARVTYVVIGADGKPYISFAGPYTSNKKNVLQFNGSVWEGTGSINPLPESVILNPIIKGDQTTRFPLLAFFESGTITMKWFNGNTWDPALPSPDSQVDRTMAFDYTFNKSGRPIVAFTKMVETVPDGYFQVVKRFNGVEWVDEYPSLFSADDRIEGFTVDSSTGVPFVTYVGRDGVLKIKTYSGSVWSELGQSGLPITTHSGTRFELDNAGIPHLILRDESAGGRVSVYRYANSSWISVGDKNISNTIMDGGKSMRLAFSSSGHPIIACTGQSKVMVFTYNGLDWLPMGEISGTGSALSLSISPEDIPYVGISLVSEDGSPSVLKFSFDP